MHVLDPKIFTTQAALLSPAQLSRLCPDEASRVIEPARQILDQAGISYHVQCRVGSAACEITQQVQESGCDGIVMGTRGMGLNENIMIGSVAAHVVHLVNVPVTLIK